MPSAPFSIFWSRYPINLASSSTSFFSNLVRELPNEFYNTIWVLVFLILHLSLKGSRAGCWCFDFRPVVDFNRAPFSFPFAVSTSTWYV